MKLALVYPRFPDPDNAYKVPPLGLAFLASYLRETFTTNLDIEVVDANALSASVEETSARLRRIRPDVVGISFLTPQANFAYDLTKAFETWPNRPLVVHGGIHVSAEPELSLRAGADYCVIGEGEETLRELLERLRDGVPMETFPGIAFLRDGVMVRGEQRPLMADLDVVPAPAWDLFDHDLYNENIHVTTEDYALPIIGSRGCPHDCSFCASPVIWRRHVRFRDPQNVVTEMLDSMLAHGVSRFHFYDDNFLLNRRWVEEFCAALEANAVCKWVCLTRAADITRNADLLPMLRRVGCCGFELGVESGDEEVLAQTGKHQETDEVERACMLLAREGFEYLGVQLMTFNEGETVQGHLRQSRFLMKILEGMRPFRIRVPISSEPPFFGQFATPYPGTRFFDSAPRSGRVLARGWSDYTTSHINYIPNSLLFRPVRLMESANVSEKVLEVLERTSRMHVFVWPDYAEHDVPELPELLRVFVELLNKGSSLDAIAAFVKSEFGYDDYLAMKFAAINLVTASQIGLVEECTSTSGSIAGIEDSSDVGRSG